MKQIPNFENYLIDENGNVYSTLSSKYIKAHLHRDGYLRIGLYNNGARKEFQVHRLVALTYIPNPQNLPQVNHKDENKLNNNVENLEWCTGQYNLTYGNRIAKAMETRKLNDPNGESYIRSMATRRKSNPHNECFKQTTKTRTLKGCVNAEKKIAQYTENGTLIAVFDSISQAAKLTNCSRGCICECAKGKKTLHKGYKWGYFGTEFDSNNNETN